MDNTARSAGFTLIEIAIVLMCIAILAMIAYPSYQEQVRKSRRSEAKALLLNAQLREENYRSNNPTYGTLAQISAPATSTNGYYSLTVTNQTATTYTLTATAQGDQSNDTECATMTLNQDGDTTPTNCW